MIRNTFTEVKVPCIYYKINGIEVDHCKDCSFFNGYKKDVFEQITGVDCLRPDIPSINCHVTSFTMKGHEYRSRYYDEEKDGKIEGDDPYDFCQKCCFSKKLENGREVCLLRTGTDSDIERFMCYEGEIWEKFPIKKDDEDDENIED